MDRWSHDPRTGAFKDKHGAYVLERDHGHKVQALLDEIAGLKARNLCLEVRPEFRYVKADDESTWPPLTDSWVVCWYEQNDRPTIINALYESCRGYFADRTFIAWMPVPAVPRT